MPLKPKPEFDPTRAMIEAAENVFLAMAHHLAIEPIVTGYQVEILRSNGWTMMPWLREKLGADCPVIRDPKLAFLLSQRDLEEYDRQCQLARRQAGLVVSEPSHCALLEAETALMQARRNLCDAMTPVTGITADQLWNLGKGVHDEYVEKTLQLLAPFVDTHAVLRRFAGEPA